MNQQREEFIKQLLIQLLEHQENVEITIVRKEQHAEKTA